MREHMRAKEFAREAYVASQSLKKSDYEDRQKLKVRV